MRERAARLAETHLSTTPTLSPGAVTQSHLMDSHTREGFFHAIYEVSLAADDDQ